MHSALRPYVTTGVAIAGATLIGAGSMLPVDAASRADAPVTASWTVDLRAQVSALSTDASGKSIANVTPNLINAVLNVPMAEINAINRFSAAMEESASWWVYSDVNVLGWDPPNEEMTKGVVDMLLPFAPLSGPSGEATFLWFAANFPMDAGCSGLPPCPHPESILSHMFKVAPWEFYLGDGYTFPEVINPVSANETYWGQELGETGDPTNWSGMTFKLDPNAGLKSVLDYLMSAPEPVELPTGKEIWDTTVRLTSALWKSFYPFVPQSTLWNPQMSISAYILRPFARVLCPDCNKADPFMPVEWSPGDDIPAGSYVPLRYKKNYDENGEWVGPLPESETTESTLLAADASTTDTEGSADAGKSDFVADAVQTLTKKFSVAPSEKESTLSTGEEQAPATDEDTSKDTTPAAEKPAEEAAEGSAGKTETGTPAETKPAETAEPDVKAGDDGTRPAKKWRFGGKHPKSDDTAKASDTASGASTDKSSDSKKSASGSGGGKTSVGAGSSSGGGSDSGSGE